VISFRVIIVLQFMKEAAEKGPSSDGEEIFDQNERNLFSVAYKNVVGTRRSAWRVASAKEVSFFIKFVCAHDRTLLFEPTCVDPALELFFG